MNTDNTVGQDMGVSREDVLRWLSELQRVFAENRQQLTDLDSAVGDGDFGISLDRGFTAVQAELTARPPADLRAVFQNVATVLIKTMGGTSGPLLGTFFLRAGAACAEKSELPPAGVVALFQAGVDVCRLNFSHGTLDDHLLMLRKIREAAAMHDQPVAVLADLCGPKIRE